MLRFLLDENDGTDEQLLRLWEGGKVKKEQYFFVLKWIEDNAAVDDDDVLMVFRFYTEIGITFAQFEEN